MVHVDKEIGKESIYYLTKLSVPKTVEHCLQGSEQWVGNKVETNSCGQILSTVTAFHGGTDENHEMFQDSNCLGTDLNPGT